MKEKARFRNELSSSIIVIGRNLKRVRLEKKMTQQELAEKADRMERATISNIECYNCDNITLNTLVRICMVLEIKVEDLIIEK